MKRIIISLLMCSLPLVAVAQTDIQEAEKKVELLEKANLPTKAVFSLGAVMSIFSTLFYCKKTKQAKVDAKILEEEIYPWVNGIFVREIKGLSPTKDLFKNGGFPKLKRLGFFDQKLFVSTDTYCPYLHRYPDDVKSEDRNDTYGVNHLGSIVGQYKLLPQAKGRGNAWQFYYLLENYSSDNDLKKPNSTAIHNDIVGPQLAKIGASAMAFVGCVVGLIAFHTYYKKAVKKVEELKETEAARN